MRARRAPTSSAVSSRASATLTLWNSWDAVRAFAGDDAETAVVPDEARAVLSRWDERSAHYELIEGPAG